MIEAIVKLITETILSLGYFGIVLMSAIDAAFMPLPSEIIISFSGFLVSEGRLNFHAVAFSGAFGNLLGSIVCYAVGYYGGRPLLHRYGRYISIRERELDIADRFFLRYGSVTVFFTKIIPMLRTYIMLTAGIARMPFFLFCIFAFGGALLYCYMLTYAGMVLGENWEQIKGYAQILDKIFLAVLLALILFWIVRRFRKRPAMS